MGSSVSDELHQQGDLLDANGQAMVDGGSKDRDVSPETEALSNDGPPNGALGDTFVPSSEQASLLSILYF